MGAQNSGQAFSTSRECHTGQERSVETLGVINAGVLSGNGMVVRALCVVVGWCRAEVSRMSRAKLAIERFSSHQSSKHVMNSRIFAMSSYNSMIPRRFLDKAT